MAWGYENSYISIIEEQIDIMSSQVEGVFKSLSEQGLGDIFRAAVMDGRIAPGAIDALSPEVAADLREIFNGVAMEEMAPGVYMWGGAGNVRVSSEYPQGRTLRAQMMKKLFNKAGANGNVTANAVKGDLAKLAFLLQKIDLLKREKELFASAPAPALKIA